MMPVSDTTIWIVITALGLGSFLLRFSFMAILGNRALPEWMLRHLRYTAVAILPGLVTPLILFPAATGGQLDPARLTAALVTAGVGYATKSVIYGFLSGGVTLYSMLYLLG
ncbi:MAG: AzlD domain-containing protein [Pseudomonadota bacterium]